MTVPRRILVAHCNHAVRDGLAGILGRNGHLVEVAYNALTARTILATCEIDVLMVGVHLPPAGAIGLLDACRVPPPTIVMGEASDPLPVSVGVDHRLSGVLSGHYSLSELLGLVEIAGRRSRAVGTVPDDTPLWDPGRADIEGWSAPGGHSPHVLVAHRYLHVREPVADALRGAGYEVAEAVDLATSLVGLRYSGADAMVVSHDLPGGGWHSLLEALDGPVPTVVLAHDYQRVDKDVVVDPRVMSVLVRPYTFDRLIDAVAAAAGRPGA